MNDFIAWCVVLTAVVIGATAALIASRRRASSGASVLAAGVVVLCLLTFTMLAAQTPGSFWIFVGFLVAWMFAGWVMHANVRTG